MSEEKNERRFHGKPDRLRSPERLALLEVERVIALSVEGLEPGRMLDVETGTGIFAEVFLANGFAVAGIDTNDAMLEGAGRLVPDGDGPAQAVS
jgi:2-polyprenyl-3-methyl-5-hydroxy-6-metoxy-1,4-benzoquinol methylase